MPTIQGPFRDCSCESHHEHGEHGVMGCVECIAKESPEGIANLFLLGLVAERERIIRFVENLGPGRPGQGHDGREAAEVIAAAIRARGGT